VIAFDFIFNFKYSNHISEMSSKMLKRILSVLIFTIILTVSAYSFEISKLPLNSQDIPSEIKYKGIFNYAFKYLDDTGENIIVYSSSNNNKIAELFVYRYLKSNKKFNIVWKDNNLKQIIYDYLFIFN
jgi:hypothetical protein